MKLLSIASASIVALATFAFAAGGAFAAVNYNSSKSNSGNVTVGPKGCPAGEVLSTNPTTGKQSCVQSDMAVKNSGVPKNTTTTAPGPKGTATATPLNNRQN
ncbi:MAG: hypothetical protein WCA78_03910 [Rhizomicrobium sp.]